MHDCVVAAHTARLGVGNDCVAVSFVVREDVERQRLIPRDRQTQIESSRSITARSVFFVYFSPRVDELDGIVSVVNAHDW